jgi:hypothetical protein
MAISCLTERLEPSFLAARISFATNGPALVAVRFVTRFFVLPIVVAWLLSAR